MKLDTTDRRLLALLQQDARLPVSELAARVALSQTSCWRRLKALGEAGVLLRHVALVDPAAVDLPVSVIVSVRLTEHHDASRGAFEALVDSRPEIVECFSMTGDWDYMLRVVVRDVAAYDRFLTGHLLHHPAVDHASSSFALRQVKYTTALPLEADDDEAARR